MESVNLNDILVFAHVVETGSFTAAASRLGVAKSSVSRCLSRLEDHLGQRLLQRTSRASVLTGAGTAYYAEVSGALGTLVTASNRANQNAEEGTVRLSAPEGVASEALPYFVAKFVLEHPGISVDVEVATRTTNLVDEGFDLAIVGGPQPDSSLVIRKLRNTPFRLFASPTYLERAGSPDSVADLAEHACVMFRSRNGACTWTLSTPEGERSVDVRGGINGNSLVFVRRVAIAGGGIALLPEVPGQHAVARGLLTPVLPHVSMETSPLHLVYPSARHVPAHVTLFRDLLLRSFPTAEELGEGMFS
ncbi:MAG: LysR family transcriptional regulator [Nannocystaceae bacterium]|nr:LysR family transcriptional regulator [Nannocystaceae bacterium]